MTDTATAFVEAAAAEGDGHAHPTEKLFVLTAIWLGLITAAEVAWSYLPWPEDADGFVRVAEIGGLLGMMAVKFFIVANVFMHLKFDKKLLTGIFYFGLFLALGVYLAVLATFSVFVPGSPPYTN